jgi:hypothetical protein
MRPEYSFVPIKLKFTIHVHDREQNTVPRVNKIAAAIVIVRQVTLKLTYSNDKMKRSERTPRLEISLRIPGAQIWWAYLAILSNPSIVSKFDGRHVRAVFFDDSYLATLASNSTQASEHKCQYFYIFWNGLSNEKNLAKAKVLLGGHADLTALVVGDFSTISRTKYEVESLYASGELHFDRFPFRFDGTTTARLLVARTKSFLMPLKNIWKAKGHRRQSVALLLGERRVVFCGSYGTTHTSLAHLCDRRGIDFSLFQDYEFYSDNPVSSLDAYMKILITNGYFLTNLYDRGDIDKSFFISTVNLLGREYFVEKIRSVGLDSFVNGYVTGVNINVYTTPFYSQHVFMDYGSVVGSGNYPRLADLKYFKKRTIEIDMNKTGLEDLLMLARRGSLARHFEEMWELVAPQIFDLMSHARTDSLSERLLR